MIAKLILTIVVALGLLMVARARTDEDGRRRTDAAAPGARLPRLLAYAFVVLMLALAGVLYFVNWHRSHEILQVRVLDGRTGKADEYRVYRGQMHGRTFTTTSGLRITLSDEDRLEVSPPH